MQIAAGWLISDCGSQVIPDSGNLECALQDTQIYPFVGERKEHLVDWAVLSGVPLAEDYFHSTGGLRERWARAYDTFTIKRHAAKTETLISQL